MLYVKWQKKVFVMNEHQIGRLLFFSILITWLIVKSIKQQQLKKSRKKSKLKIRVFKKVKMRIQLKINQIKKSVVQRRIRALKKRQIKIRKDIERLTLNEKLIDEHAIKLIYSLRGGDNGVDLDDKTYIREPDFAKCVPMIDPDHVYEVHDPVVLKHVRQLIVLNKKHPQVIDVSVALAASYKSQSIFKYVAGAAFRITVKSKHTIKNVLDTAVIWVPDGLGSYMTMGGYILLALLAVFGINLLVEQGLLLMQAGGGIIALAGIWLGGSEVVTTFNLDCNHVISKLPASTAKFIPEIERPISYVNDYNPSPYRVFVAGDKNLVIKRFGNRLPDSCYVGEEITNDAAISSKNNPFGDDLSCLQDEKKCQSEFEKISQQIDDLMYQNKFDECKQNSKNFDEATDVCAKYKQTKSSKPKFKMSEKRMKSSYHLRGRTPRYKSAATKTNSQKCFPRYNVPLGSRTKTLADLKKQDQEDFLNSSGLNKLEQYNQKARDTLRERYDLE